MSTNRKAVLYFVLPGTALVALVIILLTLPLGLGNGAPSNETIGGDLIYVLGVLGGGGLILTGLIISLIQTAQSKNWIWFGVILGEAILFSPLDPVIGFYFPWAFLIVPLTLVVYSFAGPDLSAANQGGELMAGKR